MLSHFKIPPRISLKVLLFIVCLLYGEAKGAEIDLPQEYLVFSTRGGVFAATIEDGKPVVKKIFTLEKKVPSIGVSSNHKALWIMTDEEITAQPDLAKTRLRTMLLGKEGISSMFGSGMSLSPDNQKLVYVARDKTGLNLCSENLETGEVKTLSSGWQVLIAPSWSPDGSTIAFYCDKDFGVHREEKGLRLYVVDALGSKDREIGGPSRVLRFGGESRYPVVWSAKSDAVYFEACYDTEKLGRWVYTANTDGNDNPKRVTAGMCTSIRGQDNTLFVADKGIYAVRLEKGTWRRNPVEKWPAFSPKISPSGKVLAYTKRTGLFFKTMEDGPELLIDKDYYGGFHSFYWVKTKDADAKRPDKDRDH